LLIARPFDDALFLVKSIFLPMTLFNSIGMVLFVETFKNIIREQEQKVGKKVSLTFDITKKCLPIIQRGEYNSENCDQIGEIILYFSNDLGVVFTDTKKIISTKGEIEFSKDKNNLMPENGQKVLDESKIVVAENSKTGDLFHEPLKEMIAIGSPLVKNHKTFGAMIILSKKYRISY